MRRATLNVLFLLLGSLACSEAPTPGDAGGDAGLPATVDSGTDAGPPPWTPPEVCEGVVDSTGGEVGGEGVSVSGNAFAFSISGGRIEGAYVTANEHPSWCARTDGDGYYRFEGVPVGSDITLRMHHPDFTRLQTGTHTVPAEGIERLTFQSPDHGIFAALELTLPRLDPELCQIAATITEIGRDLYTTDHPSHGEAGAVASIVPAPSNETAAGPIYFEYIGPGAILPNRSLTESTRDGGVLFLNVPPGDYVLRAEKAGVMFTEVRVRCEAGLFVNPSPPWSVQAYE